MVNLLCHSQPVGSNTIPYKAMPRLKMEQLKRHHNCVVIVVVHHNTMEQRKGQMPIPGQNLVITIKLALHVTHAHTHAHTHTHTHTHTQATCTFTCLHMHARMHARTHARTHTHTHTHTHIPTHRRHTLKHMYKDEQKGIVLSPTTAPCNLHQCAHLNTEVGAFQLAIPWTIKWILGFEHEWF